MEAVIARERLYLDKGKTRVLKEGHPDSAMLLVPKGGEVPKEYHSQSKKPEAVPQRIKELQKVTGGQKAVDAAKRRNLTVQTKDGRKDAKEFESPENKEVKTGDDKSGKPAPESNTTKDDNKKEGQGEGNPKTEEPKNE